MIMLSRNFSMEECIKSEKADALGINNTPDQTSRSHLTAVCSQMLQPIRDLYGKPIKISSGYRCPKLNAAVGGAKTSQHMTGYALDIQPVNKEDMPLLMATVMKWAKTQRFDQIIMEQCVNGVATWIHIGYRHTIKGQRYQKLLARKVNGKWTYTTYNG